MYANLNCRRASSLDAAKDANGDASVRQTANGKKPRQIAAGANLEGPPRGWPFCLQFQRRLRSKKVCVAVALRVDRWRSAL